MITDKDRAFYNGFISHVRSYHEHGIYHVPIFNIEESEILRILEQRDASIRAESADQARKEAVCKIQSLDCVNDNSSEIRRQDAVNAILNDSTTDHIPDTGEKLHQEITNAYVKKLEDDLAIAVKALEKINDRHSFADIVDDSYIISRDALREIHG